MVSTLVFMDLALQPFKEEIKKMIEKIVSTLVFMDLALQLTKTPRLEER